MTVVAGFDGWRGGWVGIVLDGGTYAGSVVAESMAEAIARLEEAAVIAVDIPMSPPRARVREAEQEAKRLLGSRSSTVFLTPPRVVLRASTYAAARAEATARFGRGVSAQAYALRHRILELEPLARADERIHEVHPELAFREMNAGTPVEDNKKTWAGQMRRRRLLAGEGIEVPDELGAVGMVPPDDVLDAAAVAWTAERIASGRARAVPAFGRRVDAIWY